MSRIAKNPVAIPAGVEVKLSEAHISAKGPIGELAMASSAAVKVEQKGNELVCSPVEGAHNARAMWGTMRANLQNLVTGVSEGFEKKLTLVGVGFRAQAQGNTLNMSVGYSHPILHKMPAGVTVETPSQTEIVIKGADRQKVGQVAAEVRAYRAPEPYKGKGVRYANEVVVMKEAKKK